MSESNFLETLEKYEQDFEDPSFASGPMTVADLKASLGNRMFSWRLYISVITVDALTVYSLESAIPSLVEPHKARATLLLEKYRIRARTRLDILSALTDSMQENHPQQSPLFHPLSSHPLRQYFQTKSSYIHPTVKAFIAALCLPDPDLDAAYEHQDTALTASQHAALEGHMLWNAHRTTEKKQTIDEETRKSIEAHFTCAKLDLVQDYIRSRLDPSFKQNFLSAPTPSYSTPPASHEDLLARLQEPISVTLPISPKVLSALEGYYLKDMFSSAWPRLSWALGISKPKAPLPTSITGFGPQDTTALRELFTSPPTTIEEFTESLSQILRTPKIYLYALPLPPSIHGQTYSIDSRRVIELSTTKADDLRRFIKGERDAWAVSALKTLVHELYHTCSPIRDSRHKGLGAKVEEDIAYDMVEEGLVEWLSIRLLKSHFPRTMLQRSRYAPDVAVIEYLHATRGPQAVTQLWEAQTSIDRLATYHTLSSKPSR